MRSSSFASLPGGHKLEASGNIGFDNVVEVAATGVDYISVGALTHSPKVFDLSWNGCCGKRCSGKWCLKDRERDWDEMITETTKEGMYDKLKRPVGGYRSGF